MKKRFLIAAALVLTLTSGIAIGASAGGYVDITASLAYPISIKYNGEVQVMKDANGNQVYPITYQGTTYVPIRAVSSMLGIAVDWEQETQTVLLGETPKSEPQIVFYKEFPDVPDFGAYAGIAPINNPDGTTDGAILYMYTANDLYAACQKNPTLFDGYDDLLTSQGFTYNGSFSGEEHGVDSPILFFKKGNITVGIGFITSDYFNIFISID